MQIPKNSDNSNLNKIYVAILNNIKKEETHLITNEFESQYWDHLENEIREIRTKNPGIIFDIPWDEN